MWTSNAVTTLTLLSSLYRQAFGAATWPSSYDELEDIMVLNQGYNARGLSRLVTPCDYPLAPGRVPAAGFVRTAFHDVAPHNAQTGEGGADASIAFELKGPNGNDNAGRAFNNSITFLSQYYSAQAPMADLIALGLYTGVRGCGGPVIPIRTGRKDATVAGPLGIPRPNSDQQGLKDTFSRMGFSTQDMIKMVACGHTLGGVHAQQFPDIAQPGKYQNEVANFDSTGSTFDNAIAVEFVGNTTKNPLVVGPEQFSSDKKVYTSDGGVTIRQLTDPQTFQDECKNILQRMIETVPRGVQLTEPIQVYDIKPGALSLTLRNNGTMQFSGEIRVRTTSRPQNSIGSVSLVYKDRNGRNSSTIPTVVVGTAGGFDDSFTFYSFSTSLSTKTSVSSFDVIVTGTDGSTTSFNNNGQSFPAQDVIIVQRPSCSLTGSVDTSGQLTAEVVVAARTDASNIGMNVNLQNRRDVPLPLLSSSPVSLSSVSTVGDFTFFKGSFKLSPEQVGSATFDVSCQSHGSSFNQKMQRLIGFGLPYINTTTPNAPGTPPTHGYNGTASADAPYPVITTASGSIPGDSSPGNPWLSWSADPPTKPTPTDVCGTSAGCDAEYWATKTIWVIETPTNILAYTVPLGTCPGSAQPTWTGKVGGKPVVVSSTAASNGWSVITSTPTPIHSVVGPTKTLHVILPTFSGAATKLEGLRLVPCGVLAFIFGFLM